MLVDSALGNESRLLKSVFQESSEVVEEVVEEISEETAAESEEETNEEATADTKICPICSKYVDINASTCECGFTF